MKHKLSDNKLKNLGRLGLLCATVMWGVAFVVMKNMLDSLPTLYILAIRFLGAAVILLPVCATKLKKLDKGYILGGAAMGAALILGYIFQTYGLEHTTPGKNAFLTSIYCVIVPFLNWAALRKKPDRYNVAAAIICTAGMAFISIEGDLSVNIGDALTAVCGFFFAVHIVTTGRCINGRDPVLLSAVQFAFAGAVALLGALITETPPASVPMGTVFGMIYLTAICTALCILLQIFGQKYTPPPQTAVIMTLEAVFGALASVIFMHELMSPRLIAGFLLTFAAVVLSETKLSFIKIWKGRTL